MEKKTMLIKWSIFGVCLSEKQTERNEEKGTKAGYEIVVEDTSL